MNTASNELSNGETLQKNHTVSPKGNDTVDTVFQTPFLGGDGVSKDTRQSLRSARSLTPSVPVANKGFTDHQHLPKPPAQPVRILLSERASQALADSGEIELEERLLADPIRDHLPASAPQRKVRGVLALLDQIERENSNRRFGD